MGYGILTGTCGPVSQKHRISRVGGNIDVTRVEEEVLAMLLAEMEEEE
jgi:hypothetical protein